jgi:alpha-tubulin suppressor-like RCC1 family protein
MAPQSTVPLLVSDAKRFATVSAGDTHVCAVARRGRAFCWGRNTHSQLGNGTASTRGAFTEVSGGLRFSTIAAGSYHTCGVTQDLGTWCWGHDLFEQLGNGPVAGSSAVPVQVSHPAGS